MGDIKCIDQGVAGIYGLRIQRELLSQRWKHANTRPVVVIGADEMIQAVVRREKTQG